MELGALAARIRPKLLILDHIIRMGASDEELLAGVLAGGYNGKVVIGKDLEKFWRGSERESSRLTLAG